MWSIIKMSKRLLEFDTKTEATGNVGSRRRYKMGKMEPVAFFRLESVVLWIGVSN